MKSGLIIGVVIGFLLGISLYGTARVIPNPAKNFYEKDGAFAYVVTDGIVSPKAVALQGAFSRRMWKASESVSSAPAGFGADIPPPVFRVEVTPDVFVVSGLCLEEQLPEKMIIDPDEVVRILELLAFHCQPPRTIPPALSAVSRWM